MGMTSALKLKSVVKNTRWVLAIETLAAARALDFLRPLASSAVIEAVRLQIPKLSGDEPVSPHIEAVNAMIAEGAFTGG